MTALRLHHPEPGLLALAPEGAPLVTDAFPALDTLVLEVTGGHLTWSLLADQRLPAAVLDDPDAAQDWLWAVYGEQAALAVADNHPQSLPATPALPDLTTTLRRLAYAHWAARWWPASTLDAIPTLSPHLLAEEIADLTETCDLALGAPTTENVDTAGHPQPPGDSTQPQLRHDTPHDQSHSNATHDQPRSISPRDQPHSDETRDQAHADTAHDQAHTDATHDQAHSDATHDQAHTDTPHDQPHSGEMRDESRGDSTHGQSHDGTVRDQSFGGAVAGGGRPRADDYALAAGGSESGGLVLARGRGGWDWRRCPPGVLDASEGAVSWQVSRVGGVTEVRVSVVAAPDCAQPVPGHLHPHARVVARAAAEVVLMRLRGDVWVGSARFPDLAEAPASVDVFVPGVGPASPSGDESAARRRIREFVRSRLSGHHIDPLLTAESTAAHTPDDF